MNAPIRVRLGLEVLELKAEAIEKVAIDGSRKYGLCNQRRK